MGLLAAPIAISMVFGDAGVFTTARVGSLAGRELVTGELTAVRMRQTAESAGKMWVHWKIAAAVKKRTPQRKANGPHAVPSGSARSGVASKNPVRRALSWGRVQTGRSG